MRDQGGGHLAPGRVVKLRVNPTDCISVAQVLDALGVQVGLISFDQAVRIALSSLLESARAAGVIPQPSFDNNLDQVMQRFRHAPSEYKKVLAVSKFLHSSESAAYVRPVILASPQRISQERRFSELKQRLEVDYVNVSQGEKEEFAELSSVLQGGIAD